MPQQHDHEVLLYEQDSELVTTPTRYVDAALTAGQPVAVVAVSEDLDGFTRSCPGRSAP